MCGESRTVMRVVFSRSGDFLPRSLTEGVTAAAWNVAFRDVGSAEYQSAMSHCTIRRAAEFKIRMWKERMADENGAVVDGNWQRGFVFDWIRSWSQIFATPGNDLCERDESAAG